MRNIIRTQKLFVALLLSIVLATVVISLQVVQFDYLTVLATFPWLGFPFLLGASISQSGQYRIYTSYEQIDPATEEETVLSNTGLIDVDGVITDIKTQISVPGAFASGTGVLFANMVDTHYRSTVDQNTMIAAELANEQSIVFMESQLPDYFLLESLAADYSRHRSVWIPVKSGQYIFVHSAFNTLGTFDETQTADIRVYTIIKVAIQCYNHRSKDNDYRHSKLMMFLQDEDLDSYHTWMPNVDGRLYNIRVQMLNYNTSDNYEIVHLFGPETNRSGDQVADTVDEFEESFFHSNSLYTSYVADADSYLFTNFRSGPIFVQEGEPVMSLITNPDGAQVAILVEAIFVPNFNARVNINVYNEESGWSAGVNQVYKYNIPYDMFLTTVELEISGEHDTSYSQGSWHVDIIRGSRIGDLSNLLNQSGTVLGNLYRLYNARRGTKLTMLTTNDGSLTFSGKDNASIQDLYHAGDTLYVWNDLEGAVASATWNLEVTGFSRVKANFRGIDRLSGTAVVQDGDY